MGEKSFAPRSDRAIGFYGLQRRLIGSIYTVINNVYHLLEFDESLWKLPYTVSKHQRCFDDITRVIELLSDGLEVDIKILLQSVLELLSLKVSVLRMGMYYCFKPSTECNILVISVNIY